MALELQPLTDNEIADGITTAIADLNKYLEAANASGLRVQLDYNTVSFIGAGYDHRVYRAEILRPVRCAS